MVANISHGPLDWVRSLRWKITWLLIVKLGMLTVLWALFFSSAHRIAVNSTSTSARFGLLDHRVRSAPVAKPTGDDP